MNIGDERMAAIGVATTCVASAAASRPADGAVRRNERFDHGHCCGEAFHAGVG
jgi:hypothetical protein